MGSFFIGEDVGSGTIKSYFKENDADVYDVATTRCNSKGRFTARYVHLEDLYKYVSESGTTS